MAVPALHDPQTVLLNATGLPDLADTGSSDRQIAATNGTNGVAGTSDDDNVPLAKARVICYTNHAFGNGVPSGMRGVDSLDSCDNGDTVFFL